MTAYESSGPGSHKPSNLQLALLFAKHPFWSTSPPIPKRSDKSIFRIGSSVKIARRARSLTSVSWEERNTNTRPGDIGHQNMDESHETSDGLKSESKIVDEKILPSVARSLTSGNTVTSLVTKDSRSSDRTPEVDVTMTTSSLQLSAQLENFTTPTDVGNKAISLSGLKKTMGSKTSLVTVSGGQKPAGRDVKKNNGSYTTLPTDVSEVVSLETDKEANSSLTNLHGKYLCFNLFFFPSLKMQTDLFSQLCSASMWPVIIYNLSCTLI